MSYKEWKDKVSDFKKVDVRGVAGYSGPRCQDIFSTIYREH